MDVELLTHKLKCLLYHLNQVCQIFGWTDTAKDKKKSTVQTNGKTRPRKNKDSQWNEIWFLKQIKHILLTFKLSKCDIYREQSKTKSEITRPWNNEIMNNFTCLTIIRLCIQGNISWWHFICCMHVIFYLSRSFKTFVNMPL